MEKDSREKLIETATQLFAEKGFAEVSIRQLAKEANVNSALIAYYFGGKEGLYQAVVENYFCRIEARMAETAMSHTEPVDKLWGFISNLANIHREMPYLRKFISREFTHPTPSIAPVINKYVSRFYKIALEFLSEGISRKEIRPDVIPQFIPLAIAGMVHFYFMADSIIGQIASLSPVLKDEQAFIKQIQEICLYGILSKEEGDQEKSGL